MNKTIDLSFYYWTLQYNGIVPTGNSDYSAKHEYIAKKYYKGQIGHEEVTDREVKYFESSGEALVWLEDKS